MWQLITRRHVKNLNLTCYLIGYSRKATKGFIFFFGIFVAFAFVDLISCCTYNLLFLLEFFFVKKRAIGFGMSRISMLKHIRLDFLLLDYIFLLFEFLFKKHLNFLVKPFPPSSFFWLSIETLTTMPFFLFLLRSSPDIIS